MTHHTARPDTDVESDPRWAALVARDPATTGFVYAVSTTGIYCRPSCGARTPLPRHVTFYPTPEAAEAGGYRPCLRCAPSAPPLAERQGEIIARLCRHIEGAEEIPPNSALAALAGMSERHMQRTFKAVTGVTPRAYALAHRAARVADALTLEGSVTAALYEAGYGSPARFYESADARLGMTPSALRRGGAGETIRFALGPCSLGSVLVAATARGVCAILLGEDPDALLQDLERRFPKAELIGGEGDFEAVVAQIVGLVEAPSAGISLPLDLRGTAFQLRVWRALTDIPPGETRSYAQLAAAVGAPRAARAVAQACKANPLAVAIPCHRVIRTDGGRSGYRWGVERKGALLAREAQALAEDARPPAQLRRSHG